MRRVILPPRDDWKKRLEDAGCYYHTIEGKPYWREGAAYEFTVAEIDRIEDASNELQAMCVELASDVVKSGDYSGFGFPAEVASIVEQSWKSPQRSSLYGRFDLGYDGKDIKLFEYNADTPTALPEASVWQWHWLEDNKLPDQFNSIHEQLLEQWPQIVEPGEHIHFAAMRDGQHEDWGNLHYLLETAAECGFPTTTLAIEDLGWDEGAKAFVDMLPRHITTLFKLYPWEWMMGDEYGWKVRDCSTRIIEPAWKMLLSTKALLPLLWKKYPAHPLLLEAHFEADVWGKTAGEWIRKPLLGREGANISRVATGREGWLPDPTIAQYDKHGYIVQRYFDVPHCDGMTPILGSWIVGEKACGLGMREDLSPVTTNASCFVPHYFVE